MLCETLPIPNSAAFFLLTPMGFVKASLLSLRSVQSAIRAKCGPPCWAMWSGWILIIPRELPILCNMDSWRCWWKILWLIVSKSDMGELSAALFASQRTVQVSQSSWFSECQGFTPARMDRGYFSRRVILQLHGQLAKLGVLWWW